MASKRARGTFGQFIQKSDQPRQVRSLRLTDATWETLGRLSEEENITRADLIENLVENGNLFEEKFSKSEIAISKEKLQAIILEILQDTTITRNGRDKGVVRKSLEALVEKLFN